MEKAAKSLDQKDAVGIALLKHSGNIGKTVFKWTYGDMGTMQLAIDVSGALREAKFRILDGDKKYALEALDRSAASNTVYWNLQVIEY